MSKKQQGLADKDMVIRALKDSFVKLDPRTQAKNPVMMLVYISAIMTTICFSSLWEG